jgi:uncharacterized repeat protein (TIGR03803 family)
MYNGFLYGMTLNGGTYDSGCIFSIDTNGSVYQNLFDFEGIFGIAPESSLTLSGNLLYGMTFEGGTNNDGVIFSLNYINAGLHNLMPNTGSINIYPNPNNGSFTISLLNINDKCIVEIYNVLGQNVYSKFPAHLSPLTINISSQPNGIYFYRVISGNGNLLGEGKIVIEK